MMRVHCYLKVEKGTNIRQGLAKTYIEVAYNSSSMPMGRHVYRAKYMLRLAFINVNIDIYINGKVDRRRYKCQRRYINGRVDL